MGDFATGSGDRVRLSRRRGEHRNRVGRTATRRSQLRTGISTSFAASNDITIDIDRSGACADYSQ